MFILLPIFAVIAFFLGLLVQRILIERKIGSVRGYVARIKEEARKNWIRERNEELKRFKEELDRERDRVEKENREKLKVLKRLERKLTDKEISLDRKVKLLSEREKELIRREKDVLAKEKIVRAKTERVDQLIREENRRLEQIAKMTITEAKAALFENLKKEAKLEAAKIVKEIKEKAMQDAKRIARSIIADAIQRCSVDVVADTTVSVVPLPSDDMKGRIIGREGRNIRTFENLTGVEVIIDDTPGVVTLSSFDPMRREIARLAMEKLVSDGRIQPTKIEQVVNKVKENFDETLRSIGEEVALELGIIGIDPEILSKIGMMKFRTSYGQNLLQHSKEVAYLAGLMAGELELDTMLARRAGLLHDIGKVIGSGFEGTHAKIGAEFASKHNEPEVVVNAIASHHEEDEFASPLAVLVHAADTISSSRPGARRESVEAYIKRLENLEEIASSFDGVERSFAIQAGREVRVMVVPEKVSDFQAKELANEIARKIEQKLQYPGQIRVTVIREVRAIEVAK
ncbi:ribonuclease Y [candidate division WOR-3 bacterium]|uniref:Ribonuclease Y n=1 Tax=candidate division WOR-3 bacterium TaxID=2052148 RepID=A0A660SLB9_UNCW3|nr:MAG: ribonuclease Y [candidate division WOR-3 bacterium]